MCRWCSNQCDLINKTNGFQRMIILSFVLLSIILIIFSFPVSKESNLFKQEFDQGVAVVHDSIGLGTQKCNTTFVTAYFHFPSKFSHEKYANWISNQRRTCLLIFTDSPELWVVPGQIIIQTTLRNEGTMLNMSSDFWYNQWLIDPESQTHKTPWLYIVWNLKPYFMSQAVMLNPFSSEYFFWIDAGYFRTPKLGDATSLTPVLGNNNTVYFMLAEQFTHQEMLGNYHYTTGMDRIMGGMFGGHGSTVRAWVSLYYTVFNEYVKRQWFVGKDQNIMNTLCMEHPDMCSFLTTLECFSEDVWFTMWDCLLRRCTCTVHKFALYAH